MKTLLASLVLVVSMSTAQASPFVGAVYAYMMYQGGNTIVKSLEAESKSPTLSKTVDAAWADNQDGYSFNITRFQYDNNKSKYVLK